VSSLISDGGTGAFASVGDVRVAVTEMSDAELSVKNKLRSNVCSEVELDWWTLTMTLL